MSASELLTFLRGHRHDVLHRISKPLVRILNDPVSDSVGVVKNFDVLSVINWIFPVSITRNELLLHCTVGLPSENQIKQ